jgi:hypothetical protein
MDVSITLDSDDCDYLLDRLRRNGDADFQAVHIRLTVALGMYHAKRDKCSIADQRLIDSLRFAECGNAERFAESGNAEKKLIQKPTHARRIASLKPN